MNPAVIDVQWDSKAGVLQGNRVSFTPVWSGINKLVETNPAGHPGQGPRCTSALLLVWRDKPQTIQLWARKKRKQLPALGHPPYTDTSWTRAGSSHVCGPCLSVCRCFKCDGKCEEHTWSPHVQPHSPVRCGYTRSAVILLRNDVPGALWSPYVYESFILHVFHPHNFLGSWELLWVQTLGSLAGCPAHRCIFPCWAPGRLVQHPCFWKQVTDKHSKCHSVTAGHCWG